MITLAPTAIDTHLGIPPTGPSPGAAQSNSLLNRAAVQSTPNAIHHDLSAIGQLKSALDAILQAAQVLASPGAFAIKAASNNGSTTFTAQANSSAVSGTYTIATNQVAQSQVLLSSAVVSATTPIGTGGDASLTVKFGALAATPGAGSSGGTVSLSASNNTLAGMADAINQAQVGITANLVTEQNGVQLELSSTQTGAAQAFSIAVTGNTDLQSLLAYSAANPGTQTVLQTAQDASVTINGATLQSANNQFAYPLPGVTITAQAPGTGTLTISPDLTGITHTITNFVNSFNQLVKVTSQVDATDSSLNAATAGISQLLTTVQQTVSGAQATAFSNAGITLNSDGTLNLNQVTLTNGLTQNQNALIPLFQNNGAGLAEQAATASATLLQPDAALQATSNQLAASLNQLAAPANASAESLNARLSAYQGEYQQLLPVLASLNATSSLLNSQLSVTLPASHGSVTQQSPHSSATQGPSLLVQASASHPDKPATY